MERGGECVSRPRKHSPGWQSVNTRIYLTKETLPDWQKLQSELGLSNNNDVAVFLLQRNHYITKDSSEDSSVSVSLSRSLVPEDSSSQRMFTSAMLEPLRLR